MVVFENLLASVTVVFAIGTDRCADGMDYLRCAFLELDATLDVLSPIYCRLLVLLLC